MPSNMNDILSKISGGHLTDDEKSVILASLGGAKVRKSADSSPKVTTPGVKIACQKFAVTMTQKDADGNDYEAEIPGAYRDFWYLTSETELTPGTRHYIATRRSTPSETNKTPWPPQYVMVTTYLGQKTLPDGSQVRMYAYDRLKSDGTKRV